jgi:hypothetical protein
LIGNNGTKKQRIEKEVIGGTEYTVIAEEATGAKATAYDIIQKLIQRHADDKIQSTNLLFGN